jgi:hypothetical protein
MAFGCCNDVTARFVGFGQNLPRFFQKNFARFGQGNVALVAFEQAHA